MKKWIFILLATCLLGSLISCQDDSWKDEIADIRQELSLQAELIAQLQQGTHITNIEETTTGYQINFSNGESIELEDGSTPIVSIGENGNWWIDGLDTGVYSKGANGTNGEDGTTPEITIGENGNWWIDGVDTGKTSTGEAGSDAPSIVSIIKTSDSFIFYFSDSSTITIESEQKFLILAWGDSLTAGGKINYPKILQTLLGDKYSVINAGVGGENTKEIAARQGGIPMMLASDVTLPADISPVEIGVKQNSGFVSTWDNSNVNLLLHGGNFTVNSCFIDGVECELKWTGESYLDDTGTYTLERKADASEESILKQGSVVFTSSMKKYRNAYANIFYIGQNRGWSSNQDLIAQYKAMVNFSTSSNYLILGLSTGTEESRKDLENDLLKEFGARFVNLRKYLSTNGLSDAGISPTEEDLIAMIEGRCPPSLLDGGDVHYNEFGYQVVAQFIYDRMSYLGIIN